MLTIEEMTIVNRIVDRYKDQIDINYAQGHLIEEMAELMVELNKYFVRGHEDRLESLIEEMIDVELQLLEMEIILKKFVFNNDIDKMHKLVSRKISEKLFKWNASCMEKENDKKSNIQT